MMKRKKGPPSTNDEETMSDDSVLSSEKLEKEELQVRKKHVFEKQGLEAKLQEIKLNMEWSETLDLVYRASVVDLQSESETENATSEDDFKREMMFYKQAQAAVLNGIPKLQKLEIPTQRPDDYFAQMVKSEEHMNKMREVLLSKKIKMEMSEKAKKLRMLRKYGKKVQQEVQQSRQAEKKKMLNLVKKYRAGKNMPGNFLDNDATDVPENAGQKSKTTGRNKKRELKNKKFGHGGQKKRSKYNTAESSASMAGFDVRKHQAVKGKKTAKQKRPGKSKRKLSKKKRK